MKDITITITGFKNKEEAISWLEEYEGSAEQSFDMVEGPSIIDIDLYIPEMKAFEEDSDKTNFNLHLQ